MKWQIWKREPKPKTIVLAPDAPFALEWKWPYKPLEVNHNVIYSAYPRPSSISIMAVTRDGRRWTMPIVYVRGGTHYTLNMPPKFEGDEYVNLEIDVHYDNLSSREYNTSKYSNN